MVKTIEELKKQEQEKTKIRETENKKKLGEITPKFQEELDALCKAHGVRIEPFVIVSDNGLVPAMRIKMQENLPIEIKNIPEKNPYGVPTK